ncbi:Facilitated trehalose transporter Tret1-like protein, partial [Sarcoptes scabiei]
SYSSLEPSSDIFPNNHNSSEQSNPYNQTKKFDDLHRHRNNHQDTVEMDSEKNRPSMKQQPSRTLYLAAASGLLGAIGMGLVLGWTAPAFDSMAQPDSEPLLKDSDADKDAKTWIGSSMTLGALAGAIFSGSISQYFGRKKALILYGIPFTIGWIMLSVAKSISLLITGRVICGISAGLLSGTAPSYVVEISVIDIRGLLGACFQLCVTIGILLVYLMGAYLSWKPLAAISMIPTILMSIFMFFMPESPSWLLSKGHTDEASKSLRRLRGQASDCDQELSVLRSESDTSKKGQGFQLSSYGLRSHWMPLILALLLMLFQQFSGINAIMFYATKIFAEAGSSIEPKYATIIIGVSQVIATLCGSFLVDRLGRKLLLIVSGLLHVLATGALGLYYYLSEEHQSNPSNDFGWVPLVSLVMFIIGFSIGYGPIPWLMVAELTPMDSRSTTSAIATTFNWTCAFIITKNFEFLKDSLTKHGTFFLFAAISFISIIFVIFMLPETKGKSAEQIQKFFQSKRSSSYNVSSSGPDNNMLNRSSSIGGSNNEKVALNKL